MATGGGGTEWVVYAKRTAANAEVPGALYPSGNDL
jgi:hypothetical protein